LLQCENNLLGIDRIGSGSFRHFVEKYIRAKQYCAAPFETDHVGRKKVLVPIVGETIRAKLVTCEPTSSITKEAFLVNSPSQRVPLKKDSLAGVFTDPPYFDNVQYAELIDFCFVWLRRVLEEAVPEFRHTSTRSCDELTGNATFQRGVEHFTNGMSEVFCHFVNALMPGKPFVFTYHHNDPKAYLPIVVAILDSGLECTATLPAAAEMVASLHIAGTASSILDSVFVCRKPVERNQFRSHQQDPFFDVGVECKKALECDAQLMIQAGVKVTAGDLKCLLAGHIARVAIRSLRSTWDHAENLVERLACAEECIRRITEMVDIHECLALVAVSN
jgi:hypothetical protein